MLLRLPLEVRNIIYHLILIQPEQPVRLVGRGEASTTILRACKQTHDEAWHIFYRNNHLLVASTRDLHDFLRSTSVTRRREIRKITIDCLFKGCLRLSYLKLKLGNYHVHSHRLNGLSRLVQLRGLKTVSIQEPRRCSRGYYPLKEAKDRDAERLKKAWLKPRPLYQRCERGRTPI